MDHQPVRPDKREELVDDDAKRRLAGEEFRGYSVNRERILRHLAAGIDISMKFPTGRDMVNQLDAGDFDDTMALLGVETRGFGIEYDLAHHRLPDLPQPLAGSHQ
jgi:hypothetical protein